MTKGDGKKGGKAKGKGFNFECWNCGEKGHRASECQKTGSSMEIGSVKEAREVEVGGVWAIAQVEAETNLDGWNVVHASRKKRTAAKKKVEEEPDEMPTKEINVVSKDMDKLVSLGKGEITVDSAAEESVCPKDWGEAYKIEEPEKWMKFKNASGGRMGHYGAKEAMFKTGEMKDKVMTLGFQVSDVQKPLAAVWRIAEKGNIVQFGPKAEHNYIQNIKTKERVAMTRKGRSYVLDAGFMIDAVFPRQAAAK